MIPISEARRLLFDRIRGRKTPWPSETGGIREAGGRILAEPVRTRVPVPHFDNSAMDGFAVRSADTAGASDASPAVLRVVGAVGAGENPQPLRESGTAVRIMTGAPIPTGADAVIPKELVREAEGTIGISKPAPDGQFVRRSGEDLKEGDEALGRGTRISTGAAAILASIGIRSVRVAKRPRVSILATGNELVTDPKELGPGKVLESNSVLLETGLIEMGCDVSGVEIVRDDPVILRAVVSKALIEADLVLLSGGVSVGDHDHVREVLVGLGVEELFWRVRQKPGKPMYAGFKGDKPVIGLPGNPYATFVGFMMYARPALFLLMGADRPDLRKLTLPAASDIRRDPERAQWLKGRLISTGGECRAEPLGRQASHLLSSLKDADVLILIPEGLNVLKKGEIVEAYELPS